MSILRALLSIVRSVFRSTIRSRETDWGFTLLLCAPYVLFLAWMHLHHEMWRDEIHFWTLARLAHGFWDLVAGDRVYDGHPPLWYWYLHVFTWFTKSAVGIQIATLVVATVAAVLFVRFAPFPRYLKVLLLFSYYYGYEYTVLSRNYVLGWLFVCLFCALYHPIRVRYVAIGLALALLSLSSFYGLALSIFLLGFFVLHQPRIAIRPADGAGPRELTIASSPRLLATLALAMAGILFCVLTISPPDPNPFSPGFELGSIKLAALPDMAYRLAAGFLPWRQFSMSDFWALSLTFWPTTSPWPLYVGSGLFLVALVALYPSWRLVLLYFIVVAGMEIFQQARHEGMPRHWGHFFMAFIAACWLLRTTYPRRNHWLSTALLTGVCAVQVQSFVIATVVDTKYAFSGGRETAAFIEGKGLQDLPFVGGPDYNVSTVAGYLRRPFFAAETEEINETVVFHARRRIFNASELMNRAIEISRAKKSPVLLVCDEHLPAPPAGVTRTHLFTSRTSTIRDETFDVYTLKAD
jgi:hypothetical protein